MKKTITKEFKFDSSHRLNDDTLSEEENRQLFGKCNNLPSHGHTYHLFVTVSGKEHHGMITNFSMLRDIVERNVVEKFDHHYINDVPEMKGIVTTCENQIVVIWNMLVQPLYNIDLVLEEIKLYETETSFATLTK
jgi:6-pyruvoyltetrahydropterin/6-carboxytetrahydropterin synthase